jgi:hypothetical protein
MCFADSASLSGSEKNSTCSGGEVDVDDMFVGGVSHLRRPGRSTQKIPCLIAVSLDEHSCPKYMRLTPVEGWDQLEVTKRVLDMVDANATLKTDGMGASTTFTTFATPISRLSRHARARTSTSPRSCTPRSRT